MGRINVTVPDVGGITPSTWADAVRADGRQADGRLRSCRRSAPACGSSSRAAIPTIRSGPAAGGATRPKCRRWRWPARPASEHRAADHLQNTVVISDLPGPTGGIMLKSTTGATIIVNDTGIYIQNGKGASIVMTGPTVTINAGAL